MHDVGASEYIPNIGAIQVNWNEIPTCPIEAIRRAGPEDSCHARYVCGPQFEILGQHDAFVAFELAITVFICALLATG